jgi:hypothetical protein
MPSFRREQAPALRHVIPLRIVGSGFCPMVRGLPRAMLAPDASVGKAENGMIVLRIILWYNSAEKYLFHFEPFNFKKQLNMRNRF